MRGAAVVFVYVTLLPVSWPLVMRPLSFTVAVLPMSTGASTYAPSASVRYVTGPPSVLPLPRVGGGVELVPSLMPPLTTLLFPSSIWPFDPSTPLTIAVFFTLIPLIARMPPTGKSCVPMYEATRAWIRRRSPLTSPIEVTQRCVIVTLPSGSALCTSTPAHSSPSLSAGVT